MSRIVSVQDTDVFVRRQNVSVGYIFAVDPLDEHVEVHDEYVHA